MSFLIWQVLVALHDLLATPRPPSVRARAIAAQHEAVYRRLAAEQRLVVWTPASRGDA